MFQGYIAEPSGPDDKAFLAMILEHNSDLYGERSFPYRAMALLMANKYPDRMHTSRKYRIDMIDDRYTRAGHS